MRDRLHWARLLAFVTGLVHQELLLRNEYLAAENRILRAHLSSRLRLSDAERPSLAEIAKRLGRKALRDIARVAKPDTILGCIDGRSRRSSMDRRRVPIPVVLGSHRRWRTSPSVLRARTAGGAMTGRAGQPGACRLGSNGRQHPAPAQSRSSARTESHDDLEGVYPATPRSARWRGLFLRGSADLARARDVLPTVLH